MTSEGSFQSLGKGFDFPSRLGVVQLKGVEPNLGAKAVRTYASILTELHYSQR